jgi:hypothetical protein
MASSAVIPLRKTSASPPDNEKGLLLNRQKTAIM